MARESSGLLGPYICGGTLIENWARDLSVWGKKPQAVLGERGKQKQNQVRLKSLHTS